jgi:hypothetical protein
MQKLISEFLLCVFDVMGFNPKVKTGFLSEAFCSFLQSIQVNAEMVH